MPPKVFSSVREAWNGVLSGAVPSSAGSGRRRVSCSSIDVTTAGLRGRSGRLSSADPLKSAEEEARDTVATAASSSIEEDDDDNDDDDDFVCSVLVRLSDDADDDEVDIDKLSDSDLKNLKVADPFLYYSIPGLRRRSYLFEDDDDDDADIRIQALQVPRVPQPRRRLRRTSLPAEVLAGAEMNSARQGRQQQQVDSSEEHQPRRGSVVQRSRRLSTEAHPTLVCDEMMRELQALDGDMDEDDLDMLEHALMMGGL